ncbi:hypothetical protein C8R46DRAFT_1304381 [Mycena filopes]|nr:hypothetical protein C8R46DRAFT_1304381 [Mycena filopes]
MDRIPSPPASVYVLLEHEQDWVRYQPFLEERGYMLRSRYRPGWVSEHLCTGKYWWDCEDLIVQKKPGILDATRISDGAQVVLKMVDTRSTEVEILEFLNKDVEVLANTRAIPLLEVFPIPDDAERSFMVMPCMREATIDPFFRTVREFVVFFQEVLEQCPLRYYFINFASSIRFSNFESRCLVLGGRVPINDRVPEISDTVPYDPFKVDLRLLGEMLQLDFVLRYAGLDFAAPLMLTLIRDDPTQRPDAAETLETVEQLVRGLTEKRLDQRLKFFHRLPEDEMIRYQTKLRLAGVQFSTEQVFPSKCILLAV